MDTPTKRLEPALQGDPTLRVEPEEPTKRDPGGPRAPEISDMPGRIDRFVILRELGRGGMGCVYAAYDEELGRQLAIKVLKPDIATGTDGRTRLVREAQALAKLKHPNVVTIYDAGEFDGHVFIAMELVEGVTLRQWLATKPRSWRAILEVFIAAGRGLVASHDAGVIHRDFKLGNVMVGGKGRVSVLDFGLARDTDMRTATDTSCGEPGPRANPFLAPTLDTLTVAGAVAGTPAYMAPEQLLGGKIDARADQFSFCVALYSALYNQRPFLGRTVDDRKKELAAGITVQFPRSPRRPHWLRRALVRGLSHDPDHRFPTMEALLSILSSDPGRRRSRIASVGALSAVLVAGGYGLAPERNPPQRICDKLAPSMWQASAKQRLKAAFTEDPAAHVAAAWPRLELLLDDYAQRWVAGRRGVCIDHTRKTHSDRLYDLQIICYERHKSAFEALISQLEEGDTNARDNALDAATALVPLDSCDDALALTTAPPPLDDPKRERQLHEIERDLDATQVALRLHRFKEGSPMAEAVVVAAEEFGDHSLHAKALTLAGRLAARNNEFDRAQEMVTRAVWLSEQVRDDPTTARAMTELIRILVSDKLDAAEALRWRPHAEALRYRLGDHRESGHLLEMEGIIFLKSGNNDVARPIFEAAITHLEAIDGLARPRARVAKIGLIRVLTAEGQPAKALPIAARMVEEREATLGPQHPNLVSLLNEYATVYIDLLEFEKALPLLERAQKIAESTGNTDDRYLEDLLSTLSQAYIELGRLDDAESLIRRLIAISTELRGPKDIRTALHLSNLGYCIYRQGRGAETLELYTRAAEILEARAPSSHFFAHILINISVVRSETGESEGNRKRIKQAIEILNLTGARTKALLSARTLLAHQSTLAGQPKAAIAPLERLLKSDIADTEQLADIRYFLALALDASSGDRQRIRELAMAARDDFGSTHPGVYARATAQMDAWIAE